MIDWLTIVIALVIITTLVGVFGFLAWKINMSDPLTGDDNNQLTDTINDKRKKEKNTNEQSKKKRKDQKKSKRENKDEEQQRNKPLQTSEETDDERDESELELIAASTQNVETSSKARKRNKNKTRTTTPPPPSTRIEANTKNPTTIRAPPATHPKSTQKDELESTKQQTKGQISSSNKQTTSSNLPTTTSKKTTQPVQKQQQQHEQPFTVVGGNRNKTATPPLQQQQNKQQVNTTTSVAPVQQPTPQVQVQVQHEQLTQRQQVTPTPLNKAPVKQQSQPKIADLLKVLPSSQVVVTELMSALDAVPLSPEELDIIMRKIANKQSVVKQDWTKLQHGQKVDPQAHVGQILDESAKAHEDDIKNNSLKYIQQLTNELNTEKRRYNDLLKEKTDQQREIQILHAQLDSVQHKQESTSGNPQQKLQTVELQLKRITEENLQLNQLLAQQQQQQQQPNLTNTGDASNMKVQVLSEQIKKLSVDNANWEKKAHSNELLAKEAQKEKEDLVRYNEQLTQSLQNAEKDLKHIEEKHHKHSNDSQTTYLNEVNEYKRRIQQLESENEQLKREEIVHVEPTTESDIQTITINNEEQEKLENEIQQLKQTIHLNQEKEREYNELKQKLTGEIENLQVNLTQRQSQENELKQEIERLKQNKNHEQQQLDESRTNELNTLRTELNEVKSTLSQSEDQREKQRHILADLLSKDLRNQLPNDNQDFNQWLSSYRQLAESDKRTLQEESTKLKHENEQLHKNMTDIENQLKEIEKTVQSKEETLFTELKSKDAVVENLRGENEQLTGELERLRHEVQHLQSVHDSSVSEARALKLQLDERFLVAANSPSIVAADESFELVKQPSPSLSPIVIDIRGEQLNQLIRSSKEGLENQDSVTQQSDKHVRDMHHTGIGETTADESTVSSDQQS